MNEIINKLTRTSTFPSEKILMYLMGLLFLIAGAYGLYQFYEGSDDIGSIEGLLILLISLRIMSGDTPFGTFRRSMYLSILGSMGIIVSVFDLLLPYTLVNLIQLITAIILTIYTVMCFIWAIKGRENNGIILRSLCMIFGILMIFVILMITDVLEFQDCLPYSILMITMGITMTGMACFRTNFPPHKENEFPISSMTLFFTGIVMLCNVFAIILMATGNAEMSMRGTMAIFLIILALRLISLGDTPFGQLNRSNIVVIIGIICMTLGMVAVIMPSHFLYSVMAYTLGLLNLVEGIKLIRMFFSNDKKIKKVKFRVGISGVATIFFGINMLLPGIFSGTMMLFTMALMAVTMISLGMTIFTIRMAEMRKFNSNNTKQ